MEAEEISTLARPLIVRSYALIGETQAMLRAHGCRIELQEQGCTVRFPVGTRRVFRERGSAEHFQLTLPDGWKLRQIVHRTGKSVLLIPLPPARIAR
jgi:hypothetical protein